MAQGLTLGPGRVFPVQVEGHGLAVSNREDVFFIPRIINGKGIVMLQSVMLKTLVEGEVIGVCFDMSKPVEVEKVAVAPESEVEDAKPKRTKKVVSKGSRGRPRLAR